MHTHTRARNLLHPWGMEDSHPPTNLLHPWGMQDPTDLYNADHAQALDLLAQLLHPQAGGATNPLERNLLGAVQVDLTAPY